MKRSYQSICRPLTSAIRFQQVPLNMVASLIHIEFINKVRERLVDLGLFKNINQLISSTQINAEYEVTDRCWLNIALSHENFALDFWFDNEFFPDGEAIIHDIVREFFG